MTNLAISKGLSMIHEMLNKLSTGIAVTLSGGATIVSALTLNDLAILAGIITTSILGVLNVLRYRQSRVISHLEIEKLKLENAKLREGERAKKE